ncbi:glycosyltransferase family 2 protein [Terrimonas alba]|uniref:glycosyltransferase family 2 protein n=1 Tax=Terrimonas alba TaxID=3349636 RepID=UPI0035F3C2EE
MKASICCITYNHEKFLKQALDGFLMQEFDDFEIVISDDYSTDKTREILKEYKAKFPKKIKLILNEKNIGMTANFILAQESCKGKYIALCEGDDYWIDPYKLQKQVDFLESNSDVSICWTLAHRYIQAENVYDDKHTELFQKDYHVNKFIDYKSIKNVKQYNLARTLTTVFRNILNYDEIKAYRYFCDTVLFQILLSKGKGIVLNSYSAVYRVHSGGIYQGASNVKNKAVALGKFVDIFRSHSTGNIRIYKNLFERYYILKNSIHKVQSENDRFQVDEAFNYYKQNVNAITKVIFSVMQFILIKINK